MPIQIDTDLVTIVSTLFGLVGVFLAVFQTFAARKAKRVYESHCRARCKDVVDLVRSMSREVIEACTILSLEIHRPKSNSPINYDLLAVLGARVNGIRLLTSRLCCFCENLNEEHKEQFGKEIFPDMKRVLPDIECLDEALVLPGPPGPTHRPEDPN